MKLNLKDEPKEWRKSALLAAIGLVVISSLFRWRHVLSNRIWLVGLGILALVAILAWWQPHWFRGFHRLSMRLGFVVSQAVGRVVLMLIFIFVLTPLGLILRLVGKDSLQLKRPVNTDTFWQTARNPGPLDRLF